jgi:hypothetical protein
MHLVLDYDTYQHTAYIIIKFKLYCREFSQVKKGTFKGVKLIVKA